MRLVLISILTAAVLGIIPETLFGEEEVVGIAIVKDGDCRYFDGLVERVAAELEILAEETRCYEFNADEAYSAGWDPERIVPSLERALNDPEIDIVMTAGILCAQAAGTEGFELAKPVVSAFVQDPEAAGLPHNLSGRSSKNNFNFVLVPLRASRDLQAFKTMIGFRQLGIVMDDVLQREMRDLSDAIAEAEKMLNARISLIPAGVSSEELIESLPEDIDGVYLTPLLRMDAADWRATIQALSDRGIPSFSMMGHPDVELGVLGGLAPDISDRLARRLALNIQQICDGSRAEDLPVPMAVDEQLVINAETALAVGYNPSVEIMMEAVFLNGEILEEGEPLEIERAIALAVEKNSSLRTRSAEVEQARHEQDLARSSMLPMIESRLQHVRIDEDRSRASFGLQPESATVAGIAASQMLFNDKSISGYRSSRHLYRSQVEESESARLDVVAEAATAYIDYLQARSIQRIAHNNLQVTRKNLELARLRGKVGSAGPGEVYRWQTELASRNAELQTTGSALESARLRLNQVMGVEMSARWSPRDFEYRAGDYFFLDGRLGPILDNDMDFSVFEEHVLDTALEESPLLRAYSENIAAQEVELERSRRSFYLPTVSLQASYDYKLDEQSPANSPSLAGFDFPTDDDREWSVGILASFPLFAGGSRMAETRRARARLDVLESMQTEAREAIERRARDAVYAIYSSYPNVALQRQAAIYAEKNMELVRRQYEQGAASIVDMLDAQNRSFAARQNQSVALYRYLSDLIEMQRSMAWFETEKNAGQKDAWVEKLRKKSLDERK